MDFHSAFSAIDTDGSGEIDVDELRAYCKKMNYKEQFVEKWLMLFDDDGSGTISYEEYCNTLGLIPKKEIIEKKSELPKKKEKTLTRAGSRNKLLSARSNLMMYSRARIFQKKALYRMKEKHVIARTNVTSKTTRTAQKIDRQETESKPIGGEKNGGTRDVVKHRYPASYPTQETRRKSALNRKTKTFSQHKRRLRASIKPGCILILLTGRHRGKRVVFLKQLVSGLLLVSGPLKLNGCPLRRVSQRYVIATKTAIDVSSVNIPERVNDLYFKRAKQSRSNQTSDIFTKEKQVYQLSEERKEDQKIVDQDIVTAIKAQPERKVIFQYLSSLFSLKNGQHPHKMIF